MTTVKTVVSLEESLLKRADRAAREMKMSRSRLFALAIETFIQQRQDEVLLKSLNEAYGDSPLDEEEKTRLRSMKAYQFQLLKDEPYG